MKMRITIGVMLISLCIAHLSSAESTATDYSMTTLVMDNSNIESMAAYGGILYVLDSDDLYMLPPGQNQKVLIDASLGSMRGEVSSVQINRLLAGENSLFGLDSEGLVLYQLTFTGDGVEKTKVFDAPEVSFSYIRDAFFSFGQLVCLTDDSIYQFDIEVGGILRLDAKNITAVTGYKDGLIIAVETKRTQLSPASNLVTLNPNTGERKVLCELGEGMQISSIAYDPSRQLGCIADRSTLYTWQEGQRAKAAASFVQGDTGQLVLITSDYAAMAIDGHIIAIREIEPDSNYQQKRLVIQDPMGRGEHYRAFIKQNSDVDLVFCKSEAYSNEERFIQDMLTQSDAVDIYLLSDQNLLTTIKEKGYAHDLQESEVISQMVRDMYKPFQLAFSDNGSILALPKKIFLPMLSYNKEAFDRLGLVPPTTYEEFFDFCLLWMEDYALQYPEYSIDSIGNVLDMNGLFKRYANEMQFNGKLLIYQSESLKRALVKYLAVMEAMKKEREAGTVSLFYVMDIPYKGSYEYMPLTFEHENTFVMDVSADDFSYFIVNPNSKNKEAAIDFLEAYIVNMEDIYRVILFDTINEAIPLDGYEKELARMEEELAALLTLLETVEPSEIKDIEDRINQQKSGIDYYQKNERWAVSQEDIDVYKMFADSVYFNPFNPIHVLESEYPELFDIHGMSTTSGMNQYLIEIDTKVRLMMAEFEMSR